MKIVLLCDNRIAIPTLEYLVESKQIAAIACPDQNVKVLEQLGLLALKAMVPIRTVSKENLTESLTSLVKEVSADTIWVMTFPYVISEEVLELPEKGVFNFHFAKLPEYRGPQPVFWEIANREEAGAVSVHLMSKELDKGPLALLEPVPLSPAETFGMHMSNLGRSGVEAAKKLLKLQGEADWKQKLVPQDESKAKYYDRPEFEDLVLNWEEMEAAELMAVIKASNPWNKGAFTAINNFTLQIVDVTLANANEPFKGEPGQVLVVDPQQGLFVVCKGGGLLRIDVVYLREGFLPGYQLMQFGVEAGNFFQNLDLPEG